MLAERVQEWTREWREQGQAEGRKQGRAEGRARIRSILHRLTARKFKTGAADQLTAAIAGLSDLERLIEVGEAIIDCNTGAELLERVRLICRREAEQQD
jgi:flagellar biosynthesis/type III secretory pathway protein FliH